LKDRLAGERRALERNPLAIHGLPDREVIDVEGWLTQLLTIAREQSALRHCAVSHTRDVGAAGELTKKSSPEKEGTSCAGGGSGAHLRGLRAATNE
jgi:hypothetical protein